MPWNPTSPDGNQSVEDNRSILQDNTTYIETTVGLDHFWTDGVDLNGHHRFMQTQATNTDDSSLETNPELDTLMNLVYYSRFKTETESVNNQDCQPYVKNIAGDADYFKNGVMQLLGIRAMGLFNVAINNSITVLYSHNIDTISRTNEGVFSVTYPATTQLPSNDYLVLGGAIGGGNNETSFAMPPSTTQDATELKDTTGFTFYTYATGTTTNLDPAQAWFICFGG